MHPLLRVPALVLAPVGESRPIRLPGPNGQGGGRGGGQGKSAGMKIKFAGIHLHVFRKTGPQKNVHRLRERAGG